MVNHSMRVFAKFLNKSKKKTKLISPISQCQSVELLLYLHRQSNYQALVNGLFFRRMTIVWMPVQINPFDHVPLMTIDLVHFAASGKKIQNWLIFSVHMLPHNAYSVEHARMKAYLLFGMLMLMMQLLHLLIVSPFRLLKWFTQILSNLILLLLYNMVSGWVLQHRSNLQNGTKLKLVSIFVTNLCVQC